MNCQYSKNQQHGLTRSRTQVTIAGLLSCNSLYKQICHLYPKGADGLYFTVTNSNFLLTAFSMLPWRKWQVKLETVLNITVQKKKKKVTGNKNVCWDGLLSITFFAGLVPAIDH